MTKKIATKMNQTNDFFVYLPSGYTSLRKWKVSDKQLTSIVFAQIENKQIH